MGRWRACSFLNPHMLVCYSQTLVRERIRLEVGSKPCNRNGVGSHMHLSLVPPDSQDLGSCGASRWKASSGILAKRLKGG